MMNKFSHLALQFPSAQLQFSAHYFGFSATFSVLVQSRRLVCHFQLQQASVLAIITKKSIPMTHLYTTCPASNSKQMLATSQFCISTADFSLNQSQSPWAALKQQHSDGVGAKQCWVFAGRKEELALQSIKLNPSERTNYSCKLVSVCTGLVLE